MSTIYLIRHGKTQANLEHRYCGSTDLSLSQEGMAELAELRYSVDDALFFTSGMRRTNETLRILFGDVAYRVLPAFREIDFGIFELHTYEELKEDPEYLQWITGDNFRNVPPGGESGQAMTERVLAAFDVLSRMDVDIVLITHGGVIAAIMEAQFPQEQKNRYQWQPQPGHGYAISCGHYREIPQ